MAIIDSQNSDEYQERIFLEEATQERKRKEIENRRYKESGAKKDIEILKAQIEEVKSILKLLEKSRKD